VTREGALRRLFASLSLLGLFLAGCGDADVCGVYNTGNVVVVDQCRTDTAGTGGDVGNEPSLPPSGD
jgi:hypothetical protein